MRQINFLVQCSACFVREAALKNLIFFIDLQGHSVEGVPRTAVLLTVRMHVELAFHARVVIWMGKSFFVRSDLSSQLVRAMYENW